MNTIDERKNGLIEYNEIIPYASSALFAIYNKNQIEEEFRNNDQLVFIQTMLVLMHFEIHDVSDVVINECKKVDEDETYIARVENILAIIKGIKKQDIKYTVNKKLRQLKKAEKKARK